MKVGLFGEKEATAAHGLAVVLCWMQFGGCPLVCYLLSKPKYQQLPFSVVLCVSACAPLSERLLKYKFVYQTNSRSVLMPVLSVRAHSFWKCIKRYFHLAPVSIAAYFALAWSSGRLSMLCMLQCKYVLHYLCCNA